MPALPTGSLLLGEYQVVRAIAAGGMGAVFEVKSRRTGVSYAAKTILRSEDARARDRFRREAELLARVDRHPGIVKVHAFGEADGGAPCMILDLVWDLARIRDAFRFMRRAVALDATTDVTGLWDQLRAIDVWARGASLAEVDRLVGPLVDDWPDQPALLAILADARRTAVDAREVERGRELMARAFRAISDSVGPTSPLEELAVVVDVARAHAAHVDLTRPEHAAERARIRRLAEQTQQAWLWLVLADVERAARQLDAATADLERARTAPRADDWLAFARRFALVELQLLGARGSGHEVARSAELYVRIYPNDDEGLRLVCGVLNEVERFDEVLALAEWRFAKTEDPVLVEALGVACLGLGRVDDAERCADRLGALGQYDSEARIRREVARRRGSAK